MVFQLQMEKANAGLSKQELLGFLGTPDATSESQGAQLLNYGYSSHGRDYLAMVVISNQEVTQIEICVKPR